ncbi:MAG: hypothetical protein KJZ54_14295 [Phycisphaerales bacterium]|nr:hypothetical protein [Phycisphaerales bacterium]
MKSSLVSSSMSRAVCSLTTLNVPRSSSSPVSVKSPSPVRSRRCRSQLPVWVSVQRSSCLSDPMLVPPHVPRSARVSRSRPSSA